MGTKNYNNYSDMITFSRASSGTALAKISYGAEEVTNGTFDADLSGWVATGAGTATWISGQVELSGVVTLEQQPVTTDSGAFLISRT